MIARSLHHVSFAVSDLEASRRFYGELLGLREIPRPDLPFAGAWYEVGDAQVHLIVPPPGAPLGAPPPSLSPLAGHAAFAIDDYEAVRDALRARGVELLEAGAEAGQLFLRDPDGHVLELIRSA